MSINIEASFPKLQERLRQCVSESTAAKRPTDFFLALCAAALKQSEQAAASKDELAMFQSHRDMCDILSGKIQ